MVYLIFVKISFNKRRISCKQFKMLMMTVRYEFQCYFAEEVCQFSYYHIFAIYKKTTASNYHANIHVLTGIFGTGEATV